VIGGVCRVQCNFLHRNRPIRSRDITRTVSSTSGAIYNLFYDFPQAWWWLGRQFASGPISDSYDDEYDIVRTDQTSILQLPSSKTRFHDRWRWLYLRPSPYLEWPPQTRITLLCVDQFESGQRFWIEKTAPNSQWNLIFWPFNNFKPLKHFIFR